VHIFLDYPAGIWAKINFQYVQGSGGNELLKLNNGHVFRKEMKFKDHSDWVCVKNTHNRKGCSARVSINSEQLLKLSRAKHTHEPEK
jgi:hypothetical protein